MVNLASKARPYFGAVVLTTLLLSIGGRYCAFIMPSGIYPEVTFPRIAVVARVPNLSTQNMDLQVTRPLEEAVSTVIGVAQVRSKTIRGGSELSIDFNPGTDMRLAKEDAWSRINAQRSKLPANTDVTVDQMTPSVFPIMSLVLRHADGDAPAQAPGNADEEDNEASHLRDYAFYQLAPQIRNMRDVLYANVAGGDIREIEVEPDPDKLLAAGLSAADLADQIGNRHIYEPVGRVERSPFAFQIIVDSRVKAAKAIEDMVIATRNNQPVTIGQVAKVRVWHQDRTLSVGTEQRDAVVISIFRRVGGNTVDISNNVRELLARRAATAQYQGEVRLRSGRFRQYLRPQCPRCHPGRRFVQHPDPSCLPAQLARHLDLGVGHPDDLGDHVPVSALERRNAQLDVAGRSGCGHRVDYRRYRGGDREHRPPYGNSHRCCP